jgi:hypothetical protein
MNPIRLAVPFLTLTLVAQDATPLHTVAHYRDAALGLEVVKAELPLRPGQPWPQVVPAPGETGVRQVFLVPPPQASVTSTSLPYLLAALEQEAEVPVRSLRYNATLRQALAAYGKTHGGVGPMRLDDPQWLEAVAQGADRPKATPEARQKAREERLRSLAKALEGFALVPGVALDSARPLLVEKAPRLADGRHWVVDTRLQAQERVPVDRALMAKAGATLDLSKAKAAPALPDPGKPLPFAVVALRAPGAKVARLNVILPQGTPTALTWHLDEGRSGERTLLEQWAGARAWAWRQGSGEPSPLVAGFQAIQARLHLGREEAGQDRRPSREEGPSLLSLLGGRAAVQETLQLDRPLAGSPGAAGEAVPLAEIPGVGVASHPWKEMLGTRKPAVPALALCVPVDRAFLYLPAPAEALAELSQGGAAFLARVSAFGRQGTLDRDLIARAQEDLGLGSGLGRRLLEAGGIKEVAVFLPDLNLLGGTELTVVADLAPTAAPLVGFLVGPEPAAVDTPRGKAWRALAGNRLFLSTSRVELDRAMALNRSGGQGSLGASEEFQVMLGKLAPTPSTRAYAYLSDPFIRRLVGPAQRILQMRQATARRELEAVAAAVELRRLDAPEAPLDLPTLRKLGYLPPDLDPAAFRVEKGSVLSLAWGPLDHLRPAPVDPPATVEAWEAQAYGAFRENYTRYWNRYFDPIALRLEARGDAGYGLDTFILPLLDQSAYRQLKQFLKADQAPAVGHAPRWARPHIASLALPVDWKALLGLKEGARRLGEMALPLPPELLGALDAEAHLAFLDAAPIIQVGGGSPAGLMATPERINQGGLMFLAPLLLGPLTRPVVLAVPLRDKAAAREGFRLLAQAPGAFPGDSLMREFEWRVHQESDRRLILSASLMGLVTLRFSLELEEDWLVVCNDTSQPAPLVTGSLPHAPSHVALTLRPGDLQEGLTAAWQAAVEAQADRAWADQRWLAPWLASGLSVEAAKERSRQVFGGAPLLDPADLGAGPAPRNLRFGTPFRPLIPARKPGEDFGLFEGVRTVEVDMTFEEDGLRTGVAWTLPPAVPGDGAPASR